MDIRIYIGTGWRKRVARWPDDLQIGTRIWLKRGWFRWSQFEVVADAAFSSVSAALVRKGLLCRDFHAMLDYDEVWHGGCWLCNSYTQGNPNETANLDYWYSEDPEEADYDWKRVGF